MDGGGRDDPGAGRWEAGCLGTTGLGVDRRCMCMKQCQCLSWSKGMNSRHSFDHHTVLSCPLHGRTCTYNTYL